MKRILILCTGNSCRSIVAEALVNAELSGIEAYSAGSNPTGAINPNARRLLERHGLWRERYHSKPIEAVMDRTFDLIVTVCDNAKESCPTLPNAPSHLHIPFTDPDGKPYEAFEELLVKMRRELLPKIQAALQDSQPKRSSRTRRS